MARTCYVKFMLKIGIFGFVGRPRTLRAHRVVNLNYRGF